MTRGKLEEIAARDHARYMEAEALVAKLGQMADYVARGREVDAAELLDEILLEQRLVRNACYERTELVSLALQGMGIKAKEEA